jgi:hypothetical protein
MRCAPPTRVFAGDSNYPGSNFGRSQGATRRSFPRVNDVNDVNEPHRVLGCGEGADTVFGLWVGRPVKTWTSC